MGTKRRTKTKSSYSSLTTKQRAFLRYLEELGYVVDADVLIDHDLRVVVRRARGVVSRFSPTFYVVPELTAYEVDSRHDQEFLDEARRLLERDGHELNVVAETEFPFEEYLNEACL